MDVEGISCFVELQTNNERSGGGAGIFWEYRIESQAENNRIVLELDLALLKSALQSVVMGMSSSSSSSSSAVPSSFDPMHGVVIMKLARRNNIPCLCIEALVSGGGQIQIYHAIPVRVLKAGDFSHYLPPRVGLPQVQLILPPYKPLRTILDRFRAMAGVSSSSTTTTTATNSCATSSSSATVVYLYGNRRTGDFSLHWDRDGASIRTYLGKLVPLPDEHSDRENDDDDDETNTNDPRRDNSNDQQQSQASVSSSQPHHVRQSASSSHPSSASPSKKRRLQGNDSCVVKVDLRKLCAALQWQHPSTNILTTAAAQPTTLVSSCLLCWVENEQFVVHATLQPSSVGFFTYYIPVHYLDREEWEE